MLFLKQPLILPFLYYKSVTTCQIDSNKVSNSKLKLDLLNCVKIEIIESTAPPQQPRKRGTIFWTPCTAEITLTAFIQLQRISFGLPFYLQLCY